MSDEPNTPSVDEAAIREKVEAEVAARYRSQFEEEKTKILSNKDQILAEKKALEERYKGLSEDDLKGYFDYKKRLETDEEMRLINEGKYDDVINKRIQAREKAWNETQAEYEERLAAAQKRAEENESRAMELENKTKEMMKRQYFKDLVSEDDSFKKDYFSDFFALQSKHALIDEASGKVYAVDAEGKKMIDTDGNPVMFNDYYAKLKVKHGLFWSGGAGSGLKGQGSNGEVFGNNPLKWSQDQKLAYIEQHGRKAYAEALAKANRN